MSQSSQPYEKIISLAAEQLALANYEDHHPDGHQTWKTATFRAVQFGSG